MTIGMYVAVCIRTAVIVTRGLCNLEPAVIRVPWLILIFVFASYVTLFDYFIVARIVCHLYEVFYYTLLTICYVTSIK